MEIKFLDKFNIIKERERFDVVLENIKKSAVVEGTNLWILFFAILIACLGLNMNSTAVVIGAMLISPLIGPIVGLGFAVAINDFPLIKIGLSSYIISTIIGLVASTIYFLITPVNDAHSEILARTTPSIYDVLIALFGGFAGIIALSSKQKGNVLPGVAIATAIMPPLCTAGYGIATGQLNFFLGAFYLFLINSVFIFAATLITTYLLKFPKKKYENIIFEKREKFITWGIIVLTLIPSLYLGNVFVKNNRFTNQAEKFIQKECVLKDDYLLNREINPDDKTITLTYVGGAVDSIQIDRMRSELVNYSLANVKLVVKHGFSMPEDGVKMKELDQLKIAYQKQVHGNELLKSRQDSVSNEQLLFKDVIRELIIIEPKIEDGLIIVKRNKTAEIDSLPPMVYFVVVNTHAILGKNDSKKWVFWLRERLGCKDVELVTQLVTKKK